MKNTKLIVGVTALALMLTVGASSAFAYQGDYTKEGPNSTPERHEVMENAFTANDYSAWKELMTGRGRVVNVINQDNFAQFAEAHRLADAGDYDDADAIRQELGLRTKNGEKVGAGFRRGMGQRSGVRVK